MAIALFCNKAALALLNAEFNRNLEGEQLNA